VNLAELHDNYSIIPAIDQIAEEVVDVTGKEIEFRARNDLQVHASTKVARERMPRHIIVFKASEGARLNHLIAHECGHILRMMRAAPEERVVPAQTPEKREVALRTLQGELTRLPIPPAAQSRIVDVWINGLVLQLTNLPVDIYIERWIRNSYPDLHEEQVRSLKVGAAENLQGLSKEVQRVTPRLLFEASNAMNFPYMMEVGKITGESYRSPYRLHANILSKGRKLQRVLSEEDQGYRGDLEHIRQWAEILGIADWFIWQDFEDMPESYYWD
jgi:hypothetical protein